MATKEKKKEGIPKNGKKRIVGGKKKRGTDNNRTQQIELQHNWHAKIGGITSLIVESQRYFGKRKEIITKLV